jgi:hypothetical protein
MRYVAIVVILIVLAVGGEWLYRSFLRPIAQPPMELKALGEHFLSLGLPSSFYAVRHGYRHSEVLAAGAYQFKGFSLPASISVCPSEAAAAAHRAKIAASPNLMHPVQNGRLVLFFPMWGADTEAMAAKVTAAFTTFNGAK